MQGLPGMSQFMSSHADKEHPRQTIENHNGKIFADSLITQDWYRECFGLTKKFTQHGWFSFGSQAEQGFLVNQLKRDFDIDFEPELVVQIVLDPVKKPFGLVLLQYCRRRAAFAKSPPITQFGLDPRIIADATRLVVQMLRTDIPTVHIDPIFSLDGETTDVTFQGVIKTRLVIAVLAEPDHWPLAERFLAQFTLCGFVVAVLMINRAGLACIVSALNDRITAEGTFWGLIVALRVIGLALLVFYIFIKDRFAADGTFQTAFVTAVMIGVPVQNDILAVLDDLPANLAHELIFICRENVPSQWKNDE